MKELAICLFLKFLIYVYNKGKIPIQLQRLASNALKQKKAIWAKICFFSFEPKQDVTVPRSCLPSHCPGNAAYCPRTRQNSGDSTDNTTYVHTEGPKTERRLENTCKTPVPSLRLRAHTVLQCSLSPGGVRGRSGGSGGGEGGEAGERSEEGVPLHWCVKSLTFWIHIDKCIITKRHWLKLHVFELTTCLEYIMQLFLTKLSSLGRKKSNFTYSFILIIISINQIIRIKLQMWCPECETKAFGENSLLR